MNERDDTRERFLVAIAEKLPADRVVELHLFSPIRQAGIESGVAVVAVEESSPDRPAVHTARYRLTQKGPDRGKWTFVAQVEADAPLATIDKVIRGVQRRSGDVEEPERLSGEEFRALLPRPTTP